MGIAFLQYNVAVLVLIMLACNFITCSRGNAKISCIEKERQALLTFKLSLADPLSRLSSWTGQDCCSWSGVLCNNITGHVMELHLYDYGLIGSEVSPSLAELKHLEFLDLSFNDFFLSKIPSFFWNLKSLRYLDLSHASFGGVVPPSLGNLSNLQELHLGGQELLKIDNLNWLSKLPTLHTLDLSSIDLSQGPDLSSRIFNLFPFISSLSLSGCGLNVIPLSSLSYKNLSNVKLLDMSANNLRGQLPDWLTRLPSIQTLDLSSNSFSGEIPAFFIPKYLRLRHLDLSSNSFSGVIPSFFIPKYSRLRRLDLSSNQLNGTIPESIRHLSNVQELYLQNNSFSGIVSKIHFNNLVHLNTLSLGSNLLTMNMSTDWVPPFQLRYLDFGSCKFENGFPRWLQTQKFLGSVHMDNVQISGSNHFEDIVPLFPSTIYHLDLSNSSILGYIPLNTPNVMPNLSTLILSHNNISGSIPISLGTLAKLEVLRLSYNNISGSIPISVCGLSNLVVLDLANNHLSGDLPQSCWSDTQLMSVLDLSFNSLTGLIPSSVGKWSQLNSLHLKNNQFFGEHPVAMESYLRLEILDLANNGFSGNLPAWVKRLKYLRILNLRSNKFDGNLVHELCAISTLQILDLAHNNFVGTIPSCFRNFSGMILGGSIEPFSSKIFGYFDSLKQVLKGRELEYQSILKFLVSLDLSSNNLVGHIPEELTLLSRLCNFNLSHNQLTGSIPKKIGNLKSLQSLDFSHNHLTGIIPQSISELTSLEHLNMSYNDLSGKIPTGNQLQTLVDPSIYEGNQGICGIQIEKECSEDEPFHFLEGDEKTKEESEMLGFYIGSIVGIVVGFWGVLSVLYFNRIWRYAYFRFVENVCEILVAKIVLCIFLLKKKFDQPR